LCRTPRKDTRFFGKVDEKTKMETRSIVAMPVKFRDTCLGVNRAD